MIQYTNIIQQDVSYFPYGMPIASLTNSETYMSGTPANRYLYNGKELLDDFGLDWGVYPAICGNYGARFYDAQIGKWHTLDPLATNYVAISPYAYVANNPIICIDPDGRKIVIANNASRALTNLAMIAATTEGRKRIYSLDKSKRTYTTNSTFWSTISGYDGPSGTISFVGSPWKQEIQGGAHSSMYVMGHEIQHASDHQASGIVGDHSLKSRINREERAVGFANYLRSVYGDGDNLRIRYDGLGLSFSGNE